MQKIDESVAVPEHRLPGVNEAIWSISVEVLVPNQAAPLPAMLTVRDGAFLVQDGKDGQEVLQLDPTLNDAVLALRHLADMLAEEGMRPTTRYPFHLVGYDEKEVDQVVFTRPATINEQVAQPGAVTLQEAMQRPTAAAPATQPAAPPAPATKPVPEYTPISNLPPWAGQVQSVDVFNAKNGKTMVKITGTSGLADGTLIFPSQVTGIPDWGRSWPQDHGVILAAVEPEVVGKIAVLKQGKYLTVEELLSVAEFTVKYEKMLAQG